MGGSQSKLRLERHRQLRDAVELVEKISRGIPAPLGRVMVLSFKVKRKERFVFFLPALCLRLGFWQNPGGNVSVLQSFERGVLGQKRIYVRFCQLHILLHGANIAASSVGLQPALEFAVRDKFLCLQADGPRVPCVADSKFSPGLCERSAAVGLVGAAG